METKDDNPIDNVTWNGVLLYLHHYINQSIIDIIRSKDISEKDAISLLSVNKDDIYKCRRLYLSENGSKVTQLYAGPPKDMNWVSFNINNNARVA